MLSRASLGLVVVLVGAAFAPLASAFHDGDRDSARRIILQGFKTAALLLLPAGGVISCYGDALLGILCGREYSRAGELFVILLSGFSLLGICSFLGEVLAASGRLGVRLAVAAGLTAIVTVSSAALLLLLGPRAAAWALPLAGGCGALVLGYLIYCLVGPCIPWASCARAGLATALLLVCLALLGQPAALTALVSSLLVGAALYLSVLAVLGEFRTVGRGSHARLRFSRQVADLPWRVRPWEGRRRKSPWGIGK
jgi:O-antigen/teichoic acid export membrane protein